MPFPVFSRSHKVEPQQAQHDDAVAHHNGLTSKQSLHAVDGFATPSIAHDFGSPDDWITTTETVPVEGLAATLPPTCTLDVTADQT